MSEILTIQEKENKASQEPNFGKGITLASGFDLGAKGALDSRSTAKTIAERDAHVTNNRAYEGMLVYVEEDEKTYQYKKGKWEEFGFNSEHFQAGIIDNVTSTDTDKALSANQGKVLKDLVDANAAAITKEVSDRKGAITGVEATIAETDKKVEAAKGRLDVVEPKVTAVEGKLEGITSTVAAEITKAKGEAVSEAKAHTTSEIEKVNTAATELGKKVTANEENISTLQNKVSTNEGEIATLKENNTQLTGRVEANEGEIVKLKAKDGEIEQSVQSVDGKVTALTSKVAEDIAAAKNEAIEGAKAHTTAEIGKIDTAYKAADTKVLSDAKTYAEEQDAIKLAEAKSYAEGKVSDLKAEFTSPSPDSELNVKVGNITVAGNLEVKGSINTIDRTELHVEDNVIELNSTGVDVTSSDVHLGIRANLGEGNSSELVYCPDTQKWIVKDGHPTVRESHGSALIKTLAFQEDITSSQNALEEKITQATSKVEGLEGRVGTVEGKANANEGRLDALEAVENVSEKIEAPTNSITLSKSPFGEKVELFINGLLYVDGFTVAGKAITWNGGFEIESDDVVVAKYVVK